MVIERAMKNPDYDRYPAEGSFERIIRHIFFQFRNLGSNCVICLKSLGKVFHKIRPCNEDVCEFQFEENELGSIFAEIKRDPEIAIFLVSTAWGAFVSNRAADLTEPFPTFLLKSSEMRPKEGNLYYVN